MKSSEWHHARTTFIEFVEKSMRKQTNKGRAFCCLFLDFHANNGIEYEIGK